MYQIQQVPDPWAMLGNGVIVTPLVTLRDEYGGVSHIIKDDSCFVLINNTDEGGFGMSCYWYPEAAAALVKIVQDEEAQG